MKHELGAQFLSSDTARFCVWAPFHTYLQLKITGLDLLHMQPQERGYFSLEVRGVQEGDLYTYILPDGRVRSDPVSKYLPQGHLGPTALVKADFPWTDKEWKGLEQKDLIFYECHVGTFTPEGTFKSLMGKISYLKSLGITCLSLMPIAQFPGRYNWGYDTTNAYAPHNAYGMPRDLKALVDACHASGIAVCLDVVYNHFGPEGCFLGDFGPYLARFYETSWGKAVNVDDEHSDEVRRYFLQNALYWLKEYHIDALRLDATHAILDFSAEPFVRQLCTAVKELSHRENRSMYTIVESNRNDSRVIRPSHEGGYGADIVWNDDFHHALHVALTDETHSYYEDFASGLKGLKTVLNQGVLYDGSLYSPYRNRTYGNSFKDIALEKLLIFSENHDQVGNRANGDRKILSFEEKKVLAVIMLLSPYLPMIFMGQEYAEKRSFKYFVDFSSRELMEKTHHERIKELISADERDILSDEQAFMHSKLSWKVDKKVHTLYQRLIKLRSLFTGLSRGQVEIDGDESALTLIYKQKWAVFCAFHAGGYRLPFTEYKVLLHTEESSYGGSKPPELSQEKIRTACPLGLVLEKI